MKTGKILKQYAKSIVKMYQKHLFKHLIQCVFDVLNDIILIR